MVHNVLPGWNEFSQRLTQDLKYCNVTVKRYKYVFHLLENDYLSKFCNCFNVTEQLKESMRLIDKDYADGKISRDKLLRLRRVLSKISDYIYYGVLSWEQLPQYEKRYAIQKNELILQKFIQNYSRDHAESIAYRTKGIIRQFMVYLENYQNENLEKINEEKLLSFLRFMNIKRPAGLKTVISSLKNFVLYLYQECIVSKDFSYVLKNPVSPHRRMYRIFSLEEKNRILEAIDTSTVLGKRDYAIFSIASDCGLRSSDISSLKLKDIDWYHSCISIVQNKTGRPLITPFKDKTGSAVADYILHARGHSDLPFVFLKETYCNTKMTSSLLYMRLEKYMDLAGVKRNPKDKLGMHTFRRSLGTELMESGSSLELVSQILGHDGTSATQLYIAYSEELLAECPLDLKSLPSLWEDQYAE